MHLYKHRNEIGRNCIKSDRNLFPRSASVPIFIQEAIISYLFLREGTLSLGNVGENRLPVSTSGCGPAGKLKISFLNSPSKIDSDFQFYF